MYTHHFYLKHFTSKDLLFSGRSNKLLLHYLFFARIQVNIFEFVMFCISLSVDVMYLNVRVASSAAQRERERERLCTSHALLLPKISSRERERERERERLCRNEFLRCREKIMFLQARIIR